MTRNKTKEPRIDGMIEVTKQNRKSLEKQYGISIPDDVVFVMPPQLLSEKLDEPEFWEK